MLTAHFVLVCVTWQWGVGTSEDYWGHWVLLADLVLWKLGGVQDQRNKCTCEVLQGLKGCVRVDLPDSKLSHWVNATWLCSSPVKTKTLNRRHCRVMSYAAMFFHVFPCFPHLMALNIFNPTACPWVFVLDHHRGSAPRRLTRLTGKVDSPRALEALELQAWEANDSRFSLNGLPCQDDRDFTMPTGGPILWFYEGRHLLKLHNKKTFCVSHAISAPCEWLASTCSDCNAEEVAMAAVPIQISLGC